jgi:hypothetical protein
MKEEYPKAKAQINYKHQSKFIYRINTFILNAIFKKKKRHNWSLKIYRLIETTKVIQINNRINYLK